MSFFCEPVASVNGVGTEWRIYHYSHPGEPVNRDYFQVEVISGLARTAVQAYPATPDGWREALERITLETTKEFQENRE